MIRLGKFVIIPFLLLCFIGCQDKDKNDGIFDEQSSDNITISDEAILTQDYSRLFTLKFTDGTTLNMQKTDKGFNIENNATASLFVFFNTWCPPCKVEIPILNSIQDKFKGSLNVIGVLTEERSFDEIDEFIKNYSISYKVAYGQENSFFMSALNGVIGVPYMVLYYPNGNFASDYLGIIPEEMLENEIKRILL